MKSRRALENPASGDRRALIKCFEAGLLVRVTGDIIALSPSLIIEKTHIEQLVDVLGGVLQKVA